MKRMLITTLLITLIVFAAYTAAPIGCLPSALAQEGNPPSNEPRPLTVFTRYPAQEAAIGKDVAFDLSLRAGTPQTVQLEVRDLPEGWTATFKGGGKVVRAAYVEPETDASVDLKVEIPEDVAVDTYHFSVIARGDRERAELPLALTVNEKLPPSLTFEVELPTLKGKANTTFRYNVKLRNDGEEDLSVNLVADAPAGFQVDFKMTGQEVSSFPIAAGELKRLDVEVQPPDEAPGGTYQVAVLAEGGEARTTTTLIAEVTEVPGEPELDVTTLDGRLSGEAYAGEETPLEIVLRNTGDAPARNVKLSASQPTGWSVEFQPEEIAEIPSDQYAEVTAKVRPAEKAVAGDYEVTIRARPEEGTSESAEFRITVRTSTVWGIVGVAIIAVAVVVVGLAVMRFGRR